MAIQDPTAEDMRQFLASRFGAEGADDVEIAIYWFANDWHGGQASNLYSALCMSPYRPGPISTLESEGDMAEMMYAELQAEFAAT